MATDCRVSTGLPAHPKTKKLIRRLGAEAGWSLVCLFLWTAGNRSDGSLDGMSAEDIELASDWAGEEGLFVSTLLAVGFLDGKEGAYAIHGWEEHNPWAAGSDARAMKARWNAVKRHHGEAEADRLVPEYAAVRSANSNAASTDAAKDKSASRNAPSPSPSPSPSVVGALALPGIEPAASTPPPLPDFDGENGNAIPSKAIVKLGNAWALPEQWGLDAEALGWEVASVLKEAEKFRQHWTVGKGAGTRRSIKGWRQSWSNWLSNAEKFSPLRRVV